MKKIKTLLLLVFLSLTTSCTKKALTKSPNLGYDVAKLSYSAIVFNIYHSNTKDNKWELLKTFTYNKKQDKEFYLDVVAEGQKGSVTLKLVNNTYTPDVVNNKEVSGTYNQETIELYNLQIDSFEGKIVGYQYFDIKNNNNEQNYLLLPLSNSEKVSYFPTVDLSKPYDNEKLNLDNILVTIQIKK